MSSRRGGSMCRGGAHWLCRPFVRYASIRTSCESTLRWLSALWDPSSRTDRVLPSSQRSLSRMDQVRDRAVTLKIRSAFGREEPCSPRTFGVLALDHHPLSLASGVPHRFSLSRHICTPVRIVERIVDLSAHPQPMQEHRELPRYCHRRPFLCVLASAGGYLFSVAS